MTRGLSVLSVAQHPPQELSTVELSRRRHANSLRMLMRLNRNIVEGAIDTSRLRALSPPFRRGGHVIELALPTQGTAHAASVMRGRSAATHTTQPAGRAQLAQGSLKAAGTDGGQAPTCALALADRLWVTHANENVKTCAAGSCATVCILMSLPLTNQPSNQNRRSRKSVKKTGPVGQLQAASLLRDRHSRGRCTGDRCRAAVIAALTVHVHIVRASYLLIFGYCGV